MRNNMSEKLNIDDDMNEDTELNGEQEDTDIEVAEDATDEELTQLQAEEETETPAKSSKEDPFIDNALRMYYRDFEGIPLLTFDEEKALSKKIMAANAEKLKSEDERSEKILSEGKRAHDLLISSNLRFVVKQAKHYIGRGLELLDLIQEGNLGLIKAAERYDYRRGFRFTTYAHWWIKQTITRAIGEKARLVRVSQKMIDNHYKYDKTRKELLQKYNREPSIDQIAEAMQMDKQKLIKLLKDTAEPLYLDAKISDEEETTYGDFIADEKYCNPEDMNMNTAKEKYLYQLLGKLKPRERKVLAMCFGFDGYSKHTYESIGKMLGVTRERIRQIRAKGLEKMAYFDHGRMEKDYGII